MKHKRILLILMMLLASVFITIGIVDRLACRSIFSVAPKLHGVYWHECDPTFEGSIRNAPIIVEVEIVSIRRRFLEESHGIVDVLPGESSFVALGSPRDPGTYDKNPVTEYTARVTTSFYGDLSVGDSVVVRRTGHAPMTTAESILDSSSNTKMELPGATRVYRAYRLPSGVLETMGPMSLNSDILLDSLTGIPVRDKYQNQLSRKSLESLVFEQKLAQRLDWQIPPSIREAFSQLAMIDPKNRPAKPATQPVAPLNSPLP